MNDSTFGSGWLPVLVILLVLFGMGGGGFGLGNNATMAGYATMADVNASLNAQSVSNGLSQIALSSANNNYETSQLINQQTMAMMNQNNSNLINAIQGFNTFRGWRGLIPQKLYELQWLFVNG